VKKVFSAMAYSRDRLTRFPKGTRKLFRRGVTFREVESAVVNAHRPIAEWFYSGKGLTAMYHESEILVEVLLRLMDEEVIALPIHDAVIVPSFHAATAQRVMESVFEEHLGVSPIVRVERERQE
jgi:hypothetical protein